MIVHSVFHKSKGDRADGPWVDWVRNEHSRSILIAGAQQVELVRHPDSYELRYIFETEAQYDYSRQHHADRYEKGDSEDKIVKGEKIPTPAGPVVMCKSVKSI